MKSYYEDSAVTIYHGDCREILPILTGGGGMQADLLLSDPPYGISYRHGFRKGGVVYGNDGVTIQGDDEPFDPRFLLSGAPKVALWGANHYANWLPAARGWLVWDKRDGDGPTDQSDCELAWTNWLSTARAFTARWRGAMRQGREQAEGRVHINQKPVALMQWCIDLAEIGVGQIVLDPFMGSGSTLRAAKDLGRKAIGIEIEERYCEIAVQRLGQEVFDLEAA